MGDKRVRKESVVEIRRLRGMNHRNFSKLGGLGARVLMLEWGAMSTDNFRSGLGIFADGPHAIIFPGIALSVASSATAVPRTPVGGSGRTTARGPGRVGAAVRLRISPSRVGRCRMVKDSFAKE